MIPSADLVRRAGHCAIAQNVPRAIDTQGGCPDEQAGRPYPEDDLVFRVEAHEEVFPVDPWVVCCNTPDVQHIRVVHGFQFDEGEPAEKLELTEHSLMYDFDAIHPAGPRVKFRVGVFGTVTRRRRGSCASSRWGCSGRSSRMTPPSSGASSSGPAP